MDVQKIYRNMLATSLAGLLYAGYFSLKKLTAAACSFPCVEVMGVPSCYLGFGGFLLLAIAAVGLMVKALQPRVAKALSLLMTAFALYASLLELPHGFPLCSVGAALAFLYFCMAHRAETGECPLCKVGERLGISFQAKE